MAIQAIIRNDINTYVNRLRFINEYDDKLRNYKVMNQDPLPEYHELDTIYINPSNKKYSFHYNKEGIVELIIGKLPSEIVSNIHLNVSNIPAKITIELKEFFAIELLVYHINKAELIRANKNKPQQSLIAIDKLLNIKPWLEGIAIYFGLIRPKNLSTEEKVIWNKNFKTWDGKNKPFTHQDYNRGVQLFRKPSNNKSQESFIGLLKSETKQKDNSIYLLQKHVGIYNKKNIGEIINFLNNNPSTPLACSLTRSGHTIAIGNYKKMGYRLIDHDRYKKSINSDSLHQDIMKRLFREKSYNPMRKCAISILVFGVEKSQDNLVPKNTFDLTEEDYWNFLISNANMSSDAGLLHLALRHGHADAIRSYIEVIEKVNMNNNTDKQKLLAAKDSGEVPGLFMALQNGHAAAVESYIKNIANINGINKQELLAAKNSDGVPGLYAALYKGNTEAIKSYIEAVVNINGIIKQELLAAKNSVGTPGLVIALRYNQTDAIAVYLKIKDNNSTYANYIMQGYENYRKTFKNDILEWARNYKPKKMKEKETYSLLISLLSFNRSNLKIFKKNTTESIKLLNNIPHWR
ncbi:hypothetical protein [Allofrancisella frigidaquae]|uniref:Ankyrin repeat domain-containing protein n=1 Tax=Allofrancisella frigidaquae TaxID=1085644 RepID=A0A6M3HT88_9GAMM|nr:hypothetical protein [Allofrancisella frigidaquae]QIV94280.1 ankyrin repeat domain-containing protein [Allofrancisella frigidaquae]